MHRIHERDTHKYGDGLLHVVHVREHDARRASSDGRLYRSDALAEDRDFDLGLDRRNAALSKLHVVVQRQ
jgi:hypothetical protein